VGGENQGNTEKLLDQNAPQACVPGVAMNDVHFPDGPSHEDIPQESIPELPVPLVLKREVRNVADPLGPQISRLPLLGAETKDLDFMLPALLAGEHTGQILNMDSRPPP
jgi:hypothetical protein